MHADVCGPSKEYQSIVDGPIPQSLSKNLPSFFQTEIRYPWSTVDLRNSFREWLHQPPQAAFLPWYQDVGSIYSVKVIEARPSNFGKTFVVIRHSVFLLAISCCFSVCASSHDDAGLASSADTRQRACWEWPHDFGSWIFFAVRVNIRWCRSSNAAWLGKQYRECRFEASKYDCYNPRHGWKPW